MTLDDALAKAAALFDEAAAEAVADSEDVLRHHGATDEELRIELNRVRAEMAAHRLSMLSTVLAQWETGLGVQ